MDEIQIKLSQEDINKIMTNIVSEKITNTIMVDMPDFNQRVKEIFQRAIFANDKNEVVKSVEFAVENSVRDGVYKALIELNFEDMVCKIAKEILQDENFVYELAKKRVTDSLGIK